MAPSCVAMDCFTLLWHKFICLYLSLFRAMMRKLLLIRGKPALPSTQTLKKRSLKVSHSLLSHNPLLYLPLKIICFCFCFVFVFFCAPSYPQAYHLVFWHMEVYSEYLRFFHSLLWECFKAQWLKPSIPFNLISLFGWVQWGFKP